MQKCPVCHHSFDTPFCPICGYDRSADAELSPTLSPLSGDLPSVSARSRERSALVSCPGCGGTAFSLEKETGLARCRVCGRTHRVAPARRRIIAIAAGDAHTAVLYDDGTVRCVGKNNCGQCNTGSWRNIVAIAGGFECTYGLRADGTVAAVGNNFDGKSMVHTLKGIRSICTGKGSQTIFLRMDGTAAALGQNDNGECNVSRWEKIVAIKDNINV